MALGQIGTVLCENGEREREREGEKGRSENKWMTLGGKVQKELRWDGFRQD